MIIVVFSVFRKSGFYPAFTLDTEARGLLPFYAILVQLDTFTVLCQNALTFTLSPPYAARRAVPVAQHMGGGSFFGGSEAFTVLRESRQVATFTAIRPYPVSHFYRFTANTQ